MNYTKQQRTDIANAFKAAKPFLNDGRGREPTSTNFICNALEESRVEGWKEAKYIVSARIHPESTVLNWLEKQIGAVEEYSGHPKVQAYRHAWLDQLIEEFTLPAETIKEFSV